ncbi:MAG: type III-B CRISPR module RAMP protein Cmr6, partial [Cyanobacteria bacterium J06621_12]
MSPQPLQRPTRPNLPNPPATKPKAKKTIITSKGGGKNNRPGGGNGGGGGGGNNRGGNSIPGSPWLKGNPQPDPTASFVEYLRWMRSPGGNYDPDTKRQI